jgi:predicted RNase H-like HicB family nuclease
MSLQEEFEVIIHPQGLLDVDYAGFWTEVVSYPACFSEGQTKEEVLTETRKAILNMILKERKEHEGASISLNDIKIKLFEAI